MFNEIVLNGSVERKEVIVNIRDLKNGLTLTVLVTGVPSMYSPCDSVCVVFGSCSQMSCMNKGVLFRTAARVCYSQDYSASNDSAYSLKPDSSASDKIIIEFRTA